MSAAVFVINKLLKDEILTSREKFGFDLNLRKNAPPKVRTWIETNSHKFISKITVCRKPIQSAIRNVANIITLGKFNKNLKGLNYDDIFHLYLYITIGNITYRIEKNEVVDLKIDRPNTGEDCREIDLRGTIVEEEEVKPSFEVFLKTGKQTKITKVVMRIRITLKEFMNNGEKYQNEFWSYNSKGNNCQNFAESLLLGNKLIPPFGETHRFIKQDSIAIFKGNPAWLEKFGNIATDLAGLFSLIKEGR